MNHICIYTEDIDLADALKIFFEGKYQITVLHSTEEAEEHLEVPSCQCKVFIYDAINPTNSDLHYLKRLKKAHPNLKIIICYVYFEEKHISESLLAAQVDAIIYKPFDLAEVDRQLQKMMMEPVPSPNEMDIQAIGTPHSI